MSVDDYYKAMGVVHSDDCPICRLDERESKAHTSVLSRLWQLEYTPLVLAIMLVVAVYIVATTRLAEYIVGGL